MASGDYKLAGVVIQLGDLFLSFIFTSKDTEKLKPHYMQGTPNKCLSRSG